MTQVIQQVNINLIPQIFGANSVLVPCSQYDKTYRAIQFNVYNGRELYSIPSTCTVLIRGTKKDLTGFEYNCEFSGSQVIFPLEPQITVLSGKAPAELRIVNGEELIGSANFLFMVEPSPLTDDTIISETQLPLLEEALQAAAEAEQSKILAEAAKDSAEESATNASESEANALTYSQNAQASANSASQSASNALTSEQNAKESEDLAQGYSEDAQGYASNASDSADSASQSAQSASQSAQHAEEVVEDIEDYVNEAKGYAEQSATNAQNASVSASNALTSENNAHTSELNAKASEDNAKQSETNASQSATSASQSATSASQSATNSANSATQSANSATQASQSATNAQTSAQNAEESATEAQAILDNIDSLIEHKADDDGIYPNMSVGSAEKLLTSETVDDQFTYQTLKHDGYARINSIHGNTLVWNQLFEPRDNGSYTNNGVTVTVQDGKFTYSGTATSSGGRAIRLNKTNAHLIKGHKYFYNFPLNAIWNNTSSQYVQQWDKGYGIKEWTPDTMDVFLGNNVVSGTTYTESGYYTVIDLTAMGLDSLTADQFRSLYPLGYYQHDTGSLLSFNGEGIKTVGFNHFDKSLAVADSRFNASGTAPMNGTTRSDYIPCLPNTDYYFKNIHGSSYITSIYWFDSDKNYISSVSVVGNSPVSTVSKSPTNASYVGINFLSTSLDTVCVNISSSKNGTYEPYSSSTLELPISQYFPQGMKSAGNVFDELTSKKAITRVGTRAYQSGDENDSTLTTDGTNTNYPLATPIETDIDLDLTYTVESGGTEQLLPINSSVPVTSPLSRNASFFYDSNVVSNLLTLLSSVAQVETSPTTHAYSVGDYLMYNYQLYRVNSAIAVGGTLTVGTNIVATTLIDVIKSL